MQLMRMAEAPAAGRNRVFRYSGSRALIGTAVLVALAVGALLLAWTTANWLAYYVAAVATIFPLIFRRLVTARFRSSNWLVRLTDHGLFIKFRSYLNFHFPDQDLSVVFISYSEIRSARFILQKQEVPDRDDGGRPTTTAKTQKWVELELASESKTLADALTGERARAFDGKNLGRISSRYHHLPVRLAAPDRLQIEWGVVPNAQTFLDALTRHTLVRPTETTSTDLVNLEELGREEQESRLLELTASGDKIAAIAMARRLYAYDLTQAKDFIDGLASKRSPPA